MSCRMRLFSRLLSAAHLSVVCCMSPVSIRYPAPKMSSSHPPSVRCAVDRECHDAVLTVPRHALLPIAVVHLCMLALPELLVRVTLGRLGQYAQSP